MPVQKIGVHLLAAAAACIGLADTAHAQQGALQVAEPKRFALVIGNAKYGDGNGNLGQLGSPCTNDPQAPGDADLMAKALSEAGWEVQKYCDQKTSEMRTEIADFNDRVLAEPRAFGVIYFSGHGAQVSSSNYLFGIDAYVDETREVAKYKQSIYAPLFGTAAINLEREMQAVEPLWGKAVVVIIDACRDDPLIAELRNAGIDIIAYPKSASTLDNMVLAFATQDGKAAPDGGLGGASRYARTLSTAIKSGAADPPKEIEILLDEVKTSIQRSTRLAQSPQRLGSLQRPPIFCVKGCPSRLDLWGAINPTFEQPNFNVTPASDAPSSTPSTPSPSAAPSATKHTSATAPLASRVRAPGKALLTPVAYQSAGGLLPAAPDSSTPSSADSATVAAEATAKDPDSVVRPVRFDVLYCAGDDLAATRQSKAAAIADVIKTMVGAKSPVAGFEVGQVRLLPVPPDVNSKLYHATDSSIRYDKKDALQRTWAGAIRGFASPTLSLVNKDKNAVDYLTVLVCDGATPKAPPPTVYLQASRADQAEQASTVRSKVLSALPHANVAKKTQIIADSPKNTEVRFFGSMQKDEANSIAKLVSDVVDHPVTVKLVRGYEDKLNGSPLIEVWLGKNEAASMSESPSADATTAAPAAAPAPPADAGNLPGKLQDVEPGGAVGHPN